LSDSDRATLIKMTRQIYPRDRLDDSYYAKVVDELEADATKDPAVAKLLQDGIASLNRVGGANFVTLSSDNQIAALKKIEDSPFFQKVRSTETVALYNNPEVWKHFGYPGASFPIGGYIHHGFNDLKWLPDPPESASPKPA
ncbi:MAG TPA: tat (twin-arginine translocation) pathway signal sequence, partial [Chloroflexota bacterium]|nr:tat (twin-arginine translocation) pathway signal sequence [Chloroflexota bacterium]